MMKIKTIIFLLSITIVSLFSDGNDGGYFETNEIFKFNNIISGQIIDFSSNVDDLSVTLGSPFVKEETIFGWDLIKYSWDGIDLYVLPDSKIIIVIKITGLNYQTVDGVKISSSIQDVQQQYGEPGYINDDTIEYYYSDFDGTWGLSFDFQDKKVNTIILSRVD